MKRFLTFLSTLVAALSLSSCLQNETTIHLNKDGSGTLVEETTFGAQATAMFAQMASMGGGDATADPIAEMFSEEKAKARATELGEGVTFEKTEPLARNGNKGGRVTYRFADINKLKIAPGEGLKETMPTPGQAEEASAKSKPLKFQYSNGKLTVVMPEPDKVDPAKVPAAPVQQPDPSPQEEAMMKQMLGDMTMKLKIVADAGIASSNATYRDGNTVTLVDMEMSKLLENPETMKKLRAVGQGNSDEAMEVIKGIPGMKMETQKEVTIELN